MPGSGSFDIDLFSSTSDISYISINTRKSFNYSVVSLMDANFEYSQVMLIKSIQFCAYSR